MTDKPNDELRGDKITRRQTLAAMLAAGMVPALARSAHAAQPDFAAFNAGYAQKIVLPAFVVLARQADAMAAGADAFCAAPDAAGLDRLKEAFNNVSDAWAAAQQFRLGPLGENQRAERFAYWPERRNIVEKQLLALLSGTDQAALEAERFAAASVAVQGLPALERIIYGEDQGRDLLQGDSAPRRCAIIVAIARNLKSIAADSTAAWKATLADPAGSAAPYAANPGEATTQFYTNLLTILQIVAEQKIGGPLGGDAAGAKPKTAEQWRSGRSLRNIAQNLATARQSTLAPGGFADLLAGSDQAGLRDDLATTFDEARAAAAASGSDFTAAITHQDQRKPVTTLLVKVNHLLDLLRQKVPPAIGITLGFNELDGDGA